MLSRTVHGTWHSMVNDVHEFKHARSPNGHESKARSEQTIMGMNMMSVVVMASRQKRMSVSMPAKNGSVFAAMLSSDYLAKQLREHGLELPLPSDLTPEVALGFAVYYEFDDLVDTILARGIRRTDYIDDLTFRGARTPEIARKLIRGGLRPTNGAFLDAAMMLQDPGLTRFYLFVATSEDLDRICQYARHSSLDVEFEIKRIATLEYTKRCGWMHPLHSLQTLAARAIVSADKNWHTWVVPHVAPHIVQYVMYVQVAMDEGYNWEAEEMLRK